MKKVSRRDVLVTGLVSLPVVLAATSAVAQAKAPKSMVQYQDKPHDSQKCSACMHFVAPDQCKLVEGKISPDGWCALFAAKG